MTDSPRATRRTVLAAPKDGEESGGRNEKSRSPSSVRSLRRTSSSPGPTHSGSKRPKDTAFRQQRLPAWQPILTPYNVIPTLFIMALVFIPLGVIFIVFSGQVQEYTFDYTTCLNVAALNEFSSAPSNLGSVPFQWRRLNKLPTYATRSSPDFDPNFTDSSSLCELRFAVDKEIFGPVFEYYRLSNYYQNQRLYVKSVDWAQLKGEAKTQSQLSDCAPLVGPNGDSPSLVYYPCGLIANSMFNDTIGGLVKVENNGESVTQVYVFPPKDIAWPYDQNKYGPSKYTLDQVRPPPFWVNNKRLVKPDGTYKQLPNLHDDERLQNWMKVAGLPVFRKTYGRSNMNIPSGIYTVLISSTYEVESYGAKKSLVISNTSWIGGKNSFLGYAYVVTGSVFLLLAIAFLIRHLIAPRRLGDTTLLSWNQEHSNTSGVSVNQ